MRIDRGNSRMTSNPEVGPEQSRLRINNLVRAGPDYFRIADHPARSRPMQYKRPTSGHLLRVDRYTPARCPGKFSERRFLR